jgi:hypothetical protein
VDVAARQRGGLYFGADFLGRSQLALVPPGAEIALHLGIDPALRASA